MQSLLRISALAVVLSVITACSSAEAHPEHRPQSPVGPRDLVVTTFDFAFQAEDTIPAGLTHVRMKNMGPAFHHVTLVKLEEGHTIRELVSSIDSGRFTPSWATYVGGPEPGRLSDETNATVDLAPGNYALLCFISGNDRIRHLAKGMVRALTVVPSSGAAGSVPEMRADARMVLRDYDFDITPTLTAGRRTIRVENNAQQPHHVDVIRLVDGKTLADANQWQRTHDGPPPFEPVGGVTPITPGQVNYFTADFVPGNYVLVCFFPDAKDGKTHMRHGMAKELRID